VEEFCLFAAERADFVNLGRGKVALERHIKPHHMHRHAALEHHLRRFRVGIDVELRRRRGVAKRRRTAHDDDPFDQLRQRAVFPKGNGKVCKRPHRNEDKLAFCGNGLAVDRIPGRLLRSGRDDRARHVHTAEPVHAVDARSGDLRAYERLCGAHENGNVPICDV